MADGNFSPADLAAVTGNGGFGGNDGLGWLILIFLMLGWGGYGNRGGAPMPDVATNAGVQAAINNQTVNSGIQQSLLSSANNNYETLQAVNNQTATLMQQNYVNQINAVQGFNNVSQQITNQTNQLSAQLSQLGFQMENCCCSIKTKMDQMQIDDLTRQLANAQNKANLAQQSQTILSNLGRFVAWAGSGAATSSAVNS